MGNHLFKTFKWVWKCELPFSVQICLLRRLYAFVLGRGKNLDNPRVKFAVLLVQLGFRFSPCTNLCGTEWNKILIHPLKARPSPQSPSPVPSNWTAKQLRKISQSGVTWNRPLTLNLISRTAPLSVLGCVTKKSCTYFKVDQWTDLR